MTPDLQNSIVHIIDADDNTVSADFVLTDLGGSDDVGSDGFDPAG